MAKKLIAEVDRNMTLKQSLDWQDKSMNLFLYDGPANL